MNVNHHESLQPHKHLRTSSSSIASKWLPAQRSLRRVPNECSSACHQYAAARPLYALVGAIPDGAISNRRDGQREIYVLRAIGARTHPPEVCDGGVLQVGAGYRACPLLCTTACLYHGSRDVWHLDIIYWMAARPGLARRSIPSSLDLPARSATRISVRDIGRMPTFIDRDPWLFL